VTSIGDSFAWPFQDPAWPGKILIQGPIALIPIIGWIATSGWLLITIDHYRAGRKELAPYGFHLQRGIWIFLVYLIYPIAFALPGAVISGLGGATDIDALQGLGALVNFVLRLLLFFLAPAITIFTYRNGISGGFDLNGIWTMSSSSPSISVLAGLMILVSGLISVGGAFLRGVGLIFTVPHGFAIGAGVVTRYEKAAGTPSLPAQPGTAG